MFFCDKNKHSGRCLQHSYSLAEAAGDDKSARLPTEKTPTKAESESKLPGDGERLRQLLAEGVRDSADQQGDGEVVELCGGPAGGSSDARDGPEESDEEDELCLVVEEGEGEERRSQQDSGDSEESGAGSRRTRTVPGQATAPPGPPSGDGL